MTAVRGDDGHSDWLDFRVPLSALDAAGVRYFDGRPFYRSAALDDWLAAVAVETYRCAPFSLGVVGFEVSGCAEASLPAGALPAKRGVGYLLPGDGVLHYGAANT